MYFNEYTEVIIFSVVCQPILCAFGYFGNIITCIVIASNKSMQSTTNVYLFNLAIADIVMLTVGIFTYTIPLIEDVNQTRYYNVKNCLVESWAFQTAINVSVMTTMAVTIERYLAICHPFLARRILSVSRAVKFIFIIWIIGILFGYMYGSEFGTVIVNNQSYCVWKRTIPFILEIESVLFFALPFTLMIVLYILMWKKLTESSKIQSNQGSRTYVVGTSEVQRNRNTFLMLVTVVTVFFIAWAPYHIGRILEDHVMTNKIFGMSRIADIALYTIINVYTVSYFLSASVNPIIYSAISSKFRDAFKEVFVKFWYMCLCKKEVKPGATDAVV